MIEELHIRGLGVIEDASLTLSPGLTVVTGETGAGKTMLVTALQLLLGARADAGLVRTGASAASVDAVINPRPPEAAAHVAGSDEPLIVAREIPADGRSRARLDGRPVPVSTLAEVLGAHVEVHAQYEHVRLSRSDVQRQLLDRYAGDPHARPLATYRDAYRRWRELADRQEHLRADARERARELDRLRFEVAEIDDAELDPVADTQLERAIERLAHAEELQRAAAEAASALGSEGAGEPVGIAVSALRRLAVDDDELSGLTDRAVALAEELGELSRDVRDYGEAIDADPERLAELQERQHLLTGLQRKYGHDVEAVLAFADEARERLARLEADEQDAGELDGQLADARAAVAAAADDVHRGRAAAAERLAEVVDGHLADLAMPHARFSVAVQRGTDEAFGADGADEITFLLAPNPGEPARPLAHAASGGERSRVSLAIEVALADVDDASVLVFDEVDAGIGGATALAVGEKLARLAAGDRRRQVLCVTHLAQLAAFADVHHVVEKGLSGGRTVTTARRVADADRVGELSRMLGGDVAADAGRDHARELLEAAQQRRAG
ncbi:MAG: DNA repair protein RecN [Nitriliruptoraceae bacterium]